MKISSKQPSGCSPLLKAEDDSIRAMIAAGPHYVVGHNRELVMGGGDHWLTAWFDRGFERGTAEILRGEWRVVSVGGAAPQGDAAAAVPDFGKSSYAVWTGATTPKASCWSLRASFSRAARA
jgi:hypothetical protein